MGFVVTLAATALPLVFALLTAVCAIAYALLDGCLLGVGILCPLIARRSDTDTLFDSIAILWGGNILLLIASVILFLTGFPLAYSTLLPVIYVPLLIMLVSLLLRAIGYECLGQESLLRPIWQGSFVLGSIAATLCQGWILGLLVEGIGAPTGANEWQRLLRLIFPLACSVGLLSSYALLGSVWLIWKTRGALQILGREVGFSTLLLTCAALIALALCAPWLSDTFAHRGLSSLPLMFTPIPPVLAVLIGWRIQRSLWGGRDGAPLLWVALLLISALVSVAVSFYPFVVPYRYTVWQAANDLPSLQLALVGVVIILPLLTLYLCLTLRDWRLKVAHRAEAVLPSAPHIGARRTAGHRVDLHLS